MSDPDKTAVAAHLYVTMRRIANRVIDVEWMSKNEEYAREVLSLARQQGVEDLSRYADLYESLIYGRTVKTTIAPSAPPPASVSKPKVQEPVVRPKYEEPNDDDDGAPPPSRYVGSLR
jgi:hypothetical protein